MKRHNYVADWQTIVALDRCRAEAHGRGGELLSRSQLIRAFIRGFDESLQVLQIAMPAVDTEDELRTAIANWIIRRHRSTPTQQEER
jgi:hypothetical protein